MDTSRDAIEAVTDVRLCWVAGGRLADIVDRTNGRFAPTAAVRKSDGCLLFTATGGSSGMVALRSTGCMERLDVFV